MEMLFKIDIHSIYFIVSGIYVIMLFSIVPMLGVIRTSLWGKIASVIIITGVIFQGVAIMLMYYTA